MNATNPTDGISLDFAAYLQAQQRRRDTHMIGGVPDYAFSLDWSIRRKLDAMGPIRALAQSLNQGTVPARRALLEIQAVAVGPQQFPDVHRMGLHCAERLGIGVPQIFIMHDSHPNAFTYATDQVDQVVVLTSKLVESLTEPELLFVIGHECGHIHNRHIVYNTLWQIMTNGVARGLLHGSLRLLGPAAWAAALLKGAFTAASWYMFGRWHRCAEITCDRAGLICSGDVESARMVPAKITMGAAHLEGVNAEAYRNQARNYNKSWLRLIELTRSHPPGPKRTHAIELFAQTSTFFSWRPELEEPETLLDKAAVDLELEKLLI